MLDNRPLTFVFQVRYSQEADSRKDRHLIRRALGQHQLTSAVKQVSHIVEPSIASMKESAISSVKVSP